MKNRNSIILTFVFFFACNADVQVLEDDDVDRTALGLHAAPRVKSIQLDTGVDLIYLEQGRKRGTPLIFIHGYTDSYRSFDRNLRIFPRRFHVYALTMRGHGDSSKPACCYTQQDFAGDVIAFMDDLDIPEAVLVGHSMGSFIAHQVAVDFPDRVAQLVLMGSAATVAGNPAALELKAAVDTLEDPIDPEFVYAFQSSTVFRPIPASFLDTIVSESLKVPASVWQQALDGMLAEDHSDRLDDITAPTLLLYGDRDQLFTAEEQDELVALIPDARLNVYKRTGHGLHWERPIRTVIDIVRFVR